MANLDDEFDKLVEQTYKLIRVKQVCGELTREEADLLTGMVEARLEIANPNSSPWDSSAYC
jgi:hypothetical protein